MTNPTMNNAANNIRVDQTQAYIDAIRRDVEKEMETKKVQTQSTSISSSAGVPVANCASAALASQNAETTAASFSQAVEAARQNDKAFTDFLRQYSNVTQNLDQAHALQVNSGDYSIQ